VDKPADLEGRSDAIRVAVLLVNGGTLLANAVAVALNVDPAIHVVAVEVDPDVGPVRVTAARASVALVDAANLVTRVRAESPRLCVVVLGNQSNPQAIVEAIRAGAAAFLDNRVSTHELAAVVKRVHAGELVYDLDDLLAVLDGPSLPPPSSPRRTARLSDRELAVLDAVATGATSKEAARRLGISLNTLRTHLKNIQVKLEARSKLEAVLIAIREGRIALPPDSD
jgi:DNA-binding NarL/FixJ family response regulator